MMRFIVRCLNNGIPDRSGMAEAATLIGIAEPVILTVDNGGTATRVAEGAEEITRIETYPTPVSYDEAIGRLAIATDHVLESRTPDIVSFSIAAAVANGRLTSAGELEENGWCGLPFAENVAASLGIAVERVLLLNDCVAGANAERIARRLQAGKAGAFMTLSTGLGGALYTNIPGKELIPDEPGHHFLKPGAKCGDGAEGHIEAHISGSGIARKYSERGEDIPHDDPRWQEIKDDFHTAIAQTLDRYKGDLGLTLQRIGFTGSVVLRGPDMMGGLQRSLDDKLGDQAPQITEAVYRDKSGLYGAAFAAKARLKAS
jgi:predicted NBD/HSP70 family sugar kinase